MRVFPPHGQRNFVAACTLEVHAGLGSGAREFPSLQSLGYIGASSSLSSSGVCSFVSHSRVCRFLGTSLPLYRLFLGSGARECGDSELQGGRHSCG